MVWKRHKRVDSARLLLHLLGPPEAPFVEPHAVREWVMQNDPGERVALQILRDGREQQVTIRLESYPLKPPAPSPPSGESPEEP